MSFRPTTKQLCGLSYEVAECYGKPHVGAFYAGSSVKSHRSEDGACCAVCGGRVGSVHHHPPLSKGKAFRLRTAAGQFALRPSLIALCGSGTTGCHNGFHGGARYKATWAWDSDDAAEKWWSGYLLTHGFAPHDPMLYCLGRWVICDASRGVSFEIRGAR